MKTASDALRIVTHEDAEEFAKKPPVRIGERIGDNDPDPGKLMDLLGDIDSLKLEIHERMRRIEAVKQAKSVLLEDALRTEALNKRLAEIGKVMSAVHAGLPVPEQEREDHAMLQISMKAPAPELQNQPASVMPEAEHVALPWPTSEDAVQESVSEQKLAPQDSLALAGDGFEEAQGTEEAILAYKVASECLERSEEARRQAEDTALEARRMLAESTQRLDSAAGRHDQAAADFQSAQEVLAAAGQAASGRASEAERSWKRAEEAAAEAGRLLEQSRMELEQARRREEALEASLQTTREEFSRAYQAATKRLEEAERFWQKGDLAAQQGQQLIDQATAELLQARSAEETAAADLVSARQELTTAYQFAAVAAQRRLDAVGFFQKTTRWMLFATALSWSALAWMLWLAFRTRVPIWGPCVAMVAIFLIAILVRNLGLREAEGS